MVLCPQCHAENRDTARFCRNCATTLMPLPSAEPGVQPADAPASSSPDVSDDQDRAALQQATPAPRPEDAETAAMDQRIQAAVATSAAPDEETIAPAAGQENSSEPVQQEPEMTAAENVAVAPPTLTPIAVGTRLLDRYTILEIISADAENNVYRVRDDSRCPSCRAENPAGETFCQNCGRELTGDERGTCLLEARAAPSDGAKSPAFIVEDRVYTPQEDEPPASEQPQPFPAGVHLAFGYKSDVGLVRGSSGDPDEDSVFAMTFSALYGSVVKPTCGLFIVADGIGGSAAGEIASKMAIQVVAAELMREIVLPILEGKELDDEFIRTQIKDAILQANAAVLQTALERQNDMGTTITLAIVVNGNAYIANVGDSRTYLFDGGRLQQITKDHSLVASLIAQGMVQRDDAYTHPQRNVIFRSLGAKPEVEVDIFPQEGNALKLKPGARLLLCCDGLWEMVRDDEIEESLWREPDPQKLCDNLVARANEMGGEDNISLVVVNVE